MDRRRTFYLCFQFGLLGVFACALLGASNLLAEREQVFKGQVIQCACESPNAAAGCPAPCPNHSAKVLLFDPKNNVAYQFDREDLPKRYVARDVLVIGILDAGSHTIRVNNVVPDVGPMIRRAKTLAIVCDACPRAMSKTTAAAYEQLVGWGRFRVIPDPKSAELVMLISANPYLGDFVTRDGPDKRIVHIETIYMNVLDPHTGESLWGDSQRVGSWFVASATKDLVDDLREIMEADVSVPQLKAFIARNHIYGVGTNMGK
jgi:hypothetical protein